MRKIRFTCGCGRTQLCSVGSPCDERQRCASCLQAEFRIDRERYRRMKEART